MRFSIVTPCLDRVGELPRMRASVRAQGHDVQHVVVDGGSADGSVEWLRSQAGLEVAVMPGEKLYASLNRAIGMASGDVVVLLNTDDELCVGALDAIARTFAAHPALDGIAAGAELVDGRTGRRTVLDHPRLCALTPRNCTSGDVLTNGKVFTRPVLARIGPFDPRWRTLSDRDFMLRACALGLRMQTISSVIYRYHLHANSLTMQGIGRNRAIAREAAEIAAVRYEEERHGPRAAYYRPWHAFALAYRVGDHILEREVGAALRLLADGLKRDPLFPVLALREMLAHWGEQSLRRGGAIERNQAGT